MDARARASREFYLRTFNYLQQYTTNRAVTAGALAAMKTETRNERLMHRAMKKKIAMRFPGEIKWVGRAFHARAASHSKFTLRGFPLALTIPSPFPRRTLGV